jgi:hypothetical protein
MPEWWPAVVFGWPAVVVSLVAATAGIVLKKPFLLVVSAILAAPFSLYLSGAKNWMAFAGPTILTALLAGAYTVKRGLLWVAWCMVALFASVALGLAVVVLQQ